MHFFILIILKINKKMFYGNIIASEFLLYELASRIRVLNYLFIWIMNYINLLKFYFYSFLQCRCN